MADWYCSSVAYTAVTQWAATTTLAVGAIRRQLATPAVGSERCFRVSAITTGITGGSEPAWTLTKAGNTTDGGVTWTECSGNSAQQQNGGVTNTWTAPIARIDTGLTTFANTNGDRLFISSDHTQTAAGAVTVTQAGSNSQAISVERTTGNIPPAAGDITSGATIICTGGSSSISMAGGGYWQGVTFKGGSGSDASVLLLLANNSNFSYKMVNCTFQLASTALSGVMGLGFAGNPLVWLENCVYNFNNVSQSLQINAGRVVFIGGATQPLPGAIPNNAFVGSLGTSLVDLQFKGMDFSNIPTGKYIVAPNTTWPAQIGFVNCKLGTYTEVWPDAGQVTPAYGMTKLDIINCDATGGYRNEWYRPAGVVRTDPTATRNGGATDGVQAVSHTYITNSVAAAIIQLEGPPLYIWNTTTGSSKTATVEIASVAALNNDDVYLELEYLGASGNPQSTVANNAPATVLTAHAAVTSSAAAWTIPLQWSPIDHQSVVYLSADSLTATLSPVNNTANVRASGEGYLSSGKFYCEFTATSVGTAAAWRVGLSNASAAQNTGLGSDANLSIGYGGGGVVTRNSGTISTFASFTTGDLICMAIDLGNNKVWWRKGAAGNWNNDVIGNQNPATNTGGTAISAITGPFVPSWSGGSVSNSDQVTANFGNSTYSGTPPSGFINWPTASVTQKLQITFTQQKVGLLRATVKVAKASTFVRVDPLITLS